MLLKEKTSIETLKLLNLKLGGVYQEDQGMASVYLNNAIGEGTIIAYETYAGISAIIFDVTLAQSVLFEKSEYHLDPIYCIFCKKGHIYHKFEDEEDFNKLKESRSFILNSEKEMMNQIRFPKNCKLQISSIYITELENKGSDQNTLRPGFKEFAKHVKEYRPTRESSALSPYSSMYLSKILNNDKKGIVGRLIIEAAILNLLASQISSYDEKENSSVGSKLLREEKERIIDLAHFVENNLSKNLDISTLSERSGLNPQKLQKGFQELFRTTVSSFVLKARLEYARHLIETTEAPISDIVYKIGLSSRSYFTKAFFNRYFTKPSAYRKLMNNSKRTYELTYKSTSVHQLSESEIQKILKTSRKRNTDLNITGCLIYDGKYFLQILEGDRSNVLEVFRSIEADEKHDNIQILWKGYKNSRYFENWSMAFANESNDELEINMRETFDIGYIEKADYNFNKGSEPFWENIKSLFSSTRL